MVSILGTMSDSDRLGFTQGKANGRLRRGHALQGAMC